MVRNYSNLNKITILGEVHSKEDNLSEFEGQKFYKFDLSIEEHRTRDGVERTYIDIYEVNVFGDHAKSVQSKLKLGQKVLINGCVRYRNAPSKICFIEAESVSFDFESYDMINEVIIIGNVGKSPEIRERKQNIVVGLISVATSRYDPITKTSDKTDWHKIHVYGTKVEYVRNNVDNGMKVIIQGRLRSIPVQREPGSMEQDGRMTFIESNFIMVVPKGMSREGGHEHMSETDDIPF